MTKREWVERAVEAAVQQGFGEKVDDDEALAYIAGIFLQARRRREETNVTG
jgi:hypothetical protein